MFASLDFPWAHVESSAALGLPSAPLGSISSTLGFTGGPRLNVVDPQRQCRDHAGPFLVQLEGLVDKR